MNLSQGSNPRAPQGREVFLSEATGGGAAAFKGLDGQDSVLYLRGDK